MYDVQTVMTSFYYKNKINCYNLIINDFHAKYAIYFFFNWNRKKMWSFGNRIYFLVELIINLY